MDFLKIHFTSNYEQWKTNSNWLPYAFPPTSAIAIVNLARLTQAESVRDPARPHLQRRGDGESDL